MSIKQAPGRKELGDARECYPNPNPQIAKDEDFAQSAKHVGLEYAALIEQLMQFGMKYVASRIIE